MTFKTPKQTKQERHLIFLTLGNWFLETLNQWQFEIMTAMLFGILSHGIAQEDDIQLFAVILMMGYAFSKLSLDRKGLSKFIWRFIKSTIWYTALMVGYSISSVQLSIQLIFVWLISGLVYVMIRYVYSKIFRYYLFKKVLNKVYLGIRKESDPLPPKDNFFNDAKLPNAVERMRLINQKAIQKDYQMILELSFMDSYRQTGLRYFTDVATCKTHREFFDKDATFVLVFRVYPFGFAIPKNSYYHLTLLTLTLSEEKAFTYLSMEHPLKLSAKKDD